MRKYIISDIHGFGNLYYAVMAYLDNVSQNEEIELYINGDLFDYGYESVDILLDVKKRIEENKFKIIYLGGNHELLMYQHYKSIKDNNLKRDDNWYDVGGLTTDLILQETLKSDDKVNDIIEFIGNLKIYQKFPETIGDKRIVLVHSACPDQVKTNNNLCIKKDNQIVNYAVWTRKNNVYGFLGNKFVEEKENRIGHKNYFTIIGHTAVDNKYGVEFFENENYLNIDGGAASYVTGHFQYNHFPLIEVCDGFLKIITFNDNNEIIYGNFFDGQRLIPYSEKDLEKARRYIDSKVKVKKMSINEDGICGYWN